MTGLSCRRTSTNSTSGFPSTSATGSDGMATPRTQPQDLEDWTQDLLIHLRYLPAISKHREAGKEDIVQTFDPHKHHGANRPGSSTTLTCASGTNLGRCTRARIKNPICRPGNLSLATHFEETDRDQVGDEFCHSHSAYLRRRCRAAGETSEDETIVAEFAEFVQREDSNLFPAICAILRRPDPRCCRRIAWDYESRCLRHLHDRLRKLGQVFLAGGARQRRSARPKALYSHHSELGRPCRTFSHRLEPRRFVQRGLEQPLIKLSRKYGILMSDWAWCVGKLKIPHPGRGYWAKTKSCKPACAATVSRFVRRRARSVRQKLDAEFRYNWGSTERREKDWLFAPYATPDEALRF